MIMIDKQKIKEIKKDPVALVPTATIGYVLVFQFIFIRELTLVCTLRAG
jgi:hypothetical protein